jgi:hypothetical protein
MNAGRPGWLFDLLSDEVLAHRPEKVEPALNGVPEAGLRRAHARAYLRQMLRQTGLLFGTPALAIERTEKAVEERLFLAVLRTLARIGLDIAVLVGAQPGRRREQLLLLFAAMAGEVEEAERIDAWIQGGPQAPLGHDSWSKVESALERRSIAFSGELVYRLVLHNAGVYADAHLFGRLAIEYLARRRFSASSAHRRLRCAARQKALLIRVLVGVMGAKHRPGFSSRRAILRQIEELQLPAGLAAELRRELKESFAGRLGLGDLLPQVRTPDLRRFILEQTLLASLLDGRPREGVLIQELAAAFAVSPLELSRIEMEMAEFYARNRGVVDVFAVSAGAGALVEQIVEPIQRALEKNFYRLLQEIRETGELSVLITRAARGHKLTDEERRKMRIQLIDIAKAIPALAIFAAPGGVLLLIALAKVLPFNILPSAFQDPPSPGKPPKPDAKRVAAGAPRPVASNPR